MDWDPLWQTPLKAGKVEQRKHYLSDPQPSQLSTRCILQLVDTRENSLTFTKLNLCLLACHAAKPIYWHCVVVKGSTAFICRVQSKENGQLVLRRPKHSNGFQGRVLKGNIWGKDCSSWTFFWLVGGEVTGRCFRSLNHQPSGSNQSGVSKLVVNM